MSTKPLEELALFECLPPEILEKYAFQILDKLGDDFIKSNYRKLSEKLNSRVDRYTIILTYFTSDVNQSYPLEKVFTSADLLYDDVAELLFKLIDLSDSEWYSFNLTDLMNVCGLGLTYNHNDGPFIDKDDPLFIKIVDDLKTICSSGKLVENICKYLSDEDTYLCIWCKDDEARLGLWVGENTNNSWSLKICGDHITESIEVHNVSKDQVFDFLDTF